jgi:hypothetical protein
VFLQLENITATAAKLSLKNPWKWQLGEQKALAAGSLYRPEVKRLWSSFTNLSNTTAITIILLVCGMSGRTYFIVVTC